ncbi:phage tail tape measure protein [Pseudomonas alkylphenolica]|uniref:phage tail tape measure protein n=1 Tax=Pseudomonas alkylphenolica TaxID=237609 RepID=UPI003395E572
MASNKLSLGFVIGGAVSSTVRSAFTEVQGHIKKLEDKGNKAKVLKSTIGETIRLREEWKKAHDSGSASAAGLLRKLDGNLDSLRKQGVAVGRLNQEYQRLGRTAKAADLQVKGHQQIEQGKAGVRSSVGQAVVGVGALGVAGKISADYQAIIRDIAIKSNVANKPQEAEMSRMVIQTSQDTGMARNDVADLVNQLVGAGMELDKALAYAPVAAKFAIGQGASGVDTASMIQALEQNAKITDPKVMQQALEAIALQGQAGSFEAADMAKWFPQLLAGMEKNGSTGLEAVSSLGAMLQVQMKTAGGSDEAANNLKNWMEKIGSGEVVDAYKKAGIDYQASLNTGIQNGMSTLESSFALAMKYIQATDPAKAAKMAEAQAKISKETDPEKAKKMLAALEQSLRTGDIFADMQVKAALTAYAANRGLYEQLKKDSQNASGILDKNLAERRESSAQMWAETGQAVNDAMRSIGDAIRPATDLVATGIKKVAQGLTNLSDGSQSVVLGLAAAAAGFMALKTLLNGLKVARGLANIGRGALLARGGSGAMGGVADAVAGNGRKTGIKPVDTGLKALGGLLGASNDADGGRSGEPQRVFVVNANALGSAGTGQSARRRQRGGRRGRRPGASAAPSAGRRAATAMPKAALAAAPAVTGVGRLGQMVKSVRGVTKLGKRLPGGAFIDAGIGGLDTALNATTKEEKAEGYGGAAGGLAGTLAGAAAGAAIGSVVPVIGTAIGGVIGGLLGGMGGESVGSLLGKSWFGGEDKPEQVAENSEGSAEKNTPAPPAVSPVVVGAAVPALSAPVPVSTLARPTSVAPTSVDSMSDEEVEKQWNELPAFARRKPIGEQSLLGNAVPGLGEGFSPTLSLDTVHKPVERAQAPTQLSQADLGMAMRALDGVTQQAGVAAPVVAKVIERSKPEALRVGQADTSNQANGMGDVVRSLVDSAKPPAMALPVAAKVVEASKAVAPKIDQAFSFAPSLAITVQGDVKDPAQLARELGPHLQQQFETFARETLARQSSNQLFDAPHV